MLILSINIIPALIFWSTNLKELLFLEPFLFKKNIPVWKFIEVIEYGAKQEGKNHQNGRVKESVGF